MEGWVDELWTTSTYKSKFSLSIQMLPPCEEVATARGRRRSRCRLHQLMGQQLRHSVELVVVGEDADSISFLVNSDLSLCLSFTSLLAWCTVLSNQRSSIL